MTIKVTLSVSLSSTNSAFQEDPKHEVAEALREALRKLESRSHSWATYRLFDVNGNTVGELYYEEEEL